MDALKEAAGTDSELAAAGNLMLEQNRIVVELAKKLDSEKEKTMDDDEA